MTVLRGHETVLLVEDEAGLRRVVGKVLRALGYEVLEAANGKAAIELWQERSRPEIDWYFGMTKSEYHECNSL
jgi:CheY-like chemotaxis protein